MKKGLLTLTIVMAILDVLAILFLFFTYGPITYFKDLLITTAMTTQSHKYLARIFYTEKMIEETLNRNYISDMKENTNPSEIKVGSYQEKEDYESVYEKQILEKDPTNDLYKIIPIEGNHYKGYVIAIYDPSRISLVSSKYFGTKGQVLEEIAREHHSKVAINASGFQEFDVYGNGAVIAGVSIQNGVLMSGDWNVKTKLIGFNQNHVLMLMDVTPKEALALKIRDAMQFGPFLIVNGKKAEISGNGGWGIAARTAIGQRQDGIVLFVVIDGRQPGYSLGSSLTELTEVLLRYKAHNAANLDGGASTSLNVEGKVYNKPCASNNNKERSLPNAWILK